MQIKIAKPWNGLNYSTSCADIKSEECPRECLVRECAHKTLTQCLFTVGTIVCDAGPTVNKHYVSVSCLPDA